MKKYIGYGTWTGEWDEPSKCPICQAKKIDEYLVAKEEFDGEDEYDQVIAKGLKDGDKVEQFECPHEFRVNGRLIDWTRDTMPIVWLEEEK